MCEFQRVNRRGIKVLPPICKYTGEYCTYCVYANKDTYNKAKAAQNNDKPQKHN